MGTASTVSFIQREPGTSRANRRREVSRVDRQFGIEFVAPGVRVSCLRLLMLTESIKTFFSLI